MDPKNFLKGESLDLLRGSPLDQTDWAAREATEPDTVQHWVPSRYTVRATSETGQLILWNTLSQTLSVFKPEQAASVLALLKPAGVESRSVGLVDYLVRRGILMPKGTDEYRKFLLAFGQQHYRNDRLELFVLSSEDCNFRCKYCYEEFARGTMLPQVRGGIKRLVEKRIQNLKELDIRWFGGEPLYGWAAVEELAPFFQQIARDHGVGYRSQMTTNGYLLTPETADRLLGWGVKSFQITLDGLPEDHDCSRPTRDGQGTFWTILENLKAMAKRPDEFFVNLRVNFDKANSPKMEQFLDLIQKELSPDTRFRMGFHAVGRWGGPNDTQLPVCGTEEKHEVMARFRAAAHARGIRIETLRDSNFLGSQVCYAARPFNLIIGASGKVMKCTVLLDTDERNVVGRLMEDGSLLVNNGKLSRWTEPSFEHDKQCQKCVVLPNCQGISCPLPRVENDSRPCVSTRTRHKKELREAVKYQTRAVHTREVLHEPRTTEEK